MFAVCVSVGGTGESASTPLIIFGMNLRSEELKFSSITAVSYLGLVPPASVCFHRLRY